MGKKIRNRRDLERLEADWRDVEEPEQVPEDYINPKFKLKYKPDGSLDDPEYHHW